MPVYIVTGKLGNGKTLCSVGKIKEKIQAGCRIATNLDLNLVAMFGETTKAPRVIRVPDKPTVDDLNCIGIGNESYDESKNGALVLDECGTWFNSRNWQDKSRKAVNDWFLHARKLGWDVFLIIQDISILDSQAREALAEHTVFCKRLDNINIPVLGTLFKAITGLKLKMPRVHVARVVYGYSPSDMLSDRWTYRGNDLFACYDTKQLFLDDYPHGPYSMLTPWHLVGRHRVEKNGEFYMRLTKIYWKRFKSPLALACGALLGVAMSAAAMSAMTYQAYTVELESIKTLRAELEAAKVASTKDSAVVPELPIPADDLRISGFMRVGPETRYNFQLVQGESVRLLNSDDLRGMGIGVNKVHACEAVLTYRGISKRVYCA